MAKHRVSLFPLTLLLLLAGLGGVGWGRSSATAVPPTADATIDFPNASLASFTNWPSLVANLSDALGLPAADTNRSIVNPAVPNWCCLTDWRNHTVVLNQTSVIASTDGGPTILLTYSNTKKLSEVAIEGLFGSEILPLTLSSARQRLAEAMSRLGISGYAYTTVSWNGTGSFIANGTVVGARTVTIVAYADLNGSVLAFGNELGMVFDVDRGRAIELRIFPWFIPEPAVVTPTQLYSNALDFLNATARGMFQSGMAYFAFDSITYNLTFQVEGRYLRDAMPGSFADYRVWVSPYDGRVTYFVEIPPQPHSQPSNEIELGVWTVLASAALIGAAVMIAAGMIYLEPLRLAALAPLLFLYLRLRKDAALDHFVRGQVYAHIVDHPGVTFSEIRDAFSLANGTTTYHLAILETLGFVSSKNEGRFRRYFSVERSGQALGRKLSGLQYEILQKTKELGAVTPSDVAKALHISKQRAGYNLRRLLDAGLLTENIEHRGAYSPTGAQESESADFTPQ